MKAERRTTREEDIREGDGPALAVPPPPKRPRWLRRSLWRLLVPFSIRDNSGALYLWRLYIIETPWFGVKLHRIVKPDDDRELHDHPWSFLSIVLKGGYVEELKHWWQGLTTFAHPTRHVRWVSFHRAEDAHRIKSLDGNRPAWTLVFTGPKRKEWGFYVEVPGNPGRTWIPETEWTHWREFLEAKGHPQAQMATDD